MNSETPDDQAASPASQLQISPELSQFIETMGLHFEDTSLSRIGGRILGLLLVAPRPVSSEEMAEALQVSRSSISTNLKMLQMGGLVEKVAFPGERLDYYIFANQGWQRALEMRLAGFLELKELGEQGLAGLEPGHPARARVEEMVALVARVQQMLEQLTAEWQSRQVTA